MGILGDLIYPEVYNDRMVLSNRPYDPVNIKACGSKTKGVADLVSVIYAKIKTV